MGTRQPAMGPTRKFVTTLTACSEAEDPIVGDIVSFKRGDEYLDVELLSEGSDGAAIKHASGEEETLDHNDYFLSDRPSLRSLWEEFLRGDRPEGVAWKDGIDAGLREKLGAAFDVLMKDTPDYHPGSGTIVRDLVHPSLYPHIDAEFAARNHPALDLWQRPYESSKFQWLPTEFAVEADGSARVKGAINNLPRADNEALYEALGELFTEFVPLFESVYGYADSLTLLDDSLEGEHELPEHDDKPVPAEECTPKSLRGRSVQVITKIIEYRLQDAETFEGVWHVEGMSHENILATGVYTLSRDEKLEGGALRFKRPYTQDDAGALFWNVAQCRPRAIDDMVDEAHIPLGSIDTLDDRAFVFPNCHVHKLSAMSVTGGSGTATRRVVVFWLVHPEHKTLGTDDVAPPNETMTFEQACDARLALMEERRLHKQSLNVRAVSLCEH